MLDLASQRAVVTGEWYIPGHKAMGLRSPSLEFEELRIVPFTAIMWEEKEWVKSMMDLWMCEV